MSWALWWTISLPSEIVLNRLCLIWHCVVEGANVVIKQVSHTINQPVGIFCVAGVFNCELCYICIVCILFVCINISKFKLFNCSYMLDLSVSNRFLATDLFQIVFNMSCLFYYGLLGVPFAGRQLCSQYLQDCWGPLHQSFRDVVWWVPLEISRAQF